MALPDLPGYSRLKPQELRERGLSSKTRAVETPGGEVISRRQYENLRIANARNLYPEVLGWRSWSHFQGARKAPLYQYDMDKALKANPDKSAKQMRQIDSRFNRLFSGAMPHWKYRRSPEYRDPNGPVARFLVYLGFRSEADTHDVGETQPA